MLYRRFAAAAAAGHAAACPPPMPFLHACNATHVSLRLQLLNIIMQLCSHGQPPCPLCAFFWQVNSRQTSQTVAGAMVAWAATFWRSYVHISTHRTT